MSEQIIQNLLTQVKAINKKYESIAEITGENFNIFRILGLESREVRTHSAFIGELLNPKGSHGQGAVFLQLFCEHLMLEQFDFTQAKVEIEKHVGTISADYTTGGFIDIIVSDGNKCSIIIENKIYADDQENQILRYYNYAKNSGMDFSLYYLTLYGSNPKEKSANDLKKDEHFYCLSYKNDILNWLEKCKEKSVSHPILRETITQYIHLLKHLTHQTLNYKQLMETIDLILSDEKSFDASKSIVMAMSKIQNDLFNEVHKELEASWGHSHQTENNIREVPIFNYKSYRFILRPNSAEGYGFYFELYPMAQNEKKEYSIFGCANDNDVLPIRDLAQSFGNAFDKNSRNYTACIPFDQPLAKRSFEDILRIRNANERSQWIEECVEKMNLYITYLYDQLNKKSESFEPIIKSYK